MGSKIVIAEDDEASRYIYQTVLERRGYEVSLHGTGASALFEVQREAPVLVITDMGLPDMSGIELTRLLRIDPATAAVPVAVITVYAYEDEKRRAMEAGATAFLTKPVEWDDVVAELERIAGPPQRG